MRGLARGVLALYPLAYRRRYGEEMEVLLEDSEVGVSTVVDLAKGAAVAHLRPSPALAAEVPPGDRVRASAVGLLACWLLFALAGLAFYKTTEEEGFHHLGELHPVLGFAHLAVQMLAIAGSFGVAAAVVPFAVAALRRSRDDREARTAAIGAVASVGLLLLATGGIVLLARAGGPAPPGVALAALAAWTLLALLALLAGIGCVLAARRGLFAIPIRRPALRALLALGSLVAVAMAAMVLAAGVYLVGLISDAPSAGAQPNGPLGLVSVAASLAIQVAVMLVATALAGASSLRGWRAPHGSAGL